MYKILCVGEIVNTHGIKGELKIVPLVDNANDLLEYTHFFVDNVDYEVESSRMHNEFALIKLKGIDGMTEAQRYKGMFLELPRNELKPLPNGKCYICDLIGLRVIDDMIGEVGTINDVFETASNDVYVVEYNGSPLCIPVLEGVVHEVDLENGVVSVTIPKGLL